ncbi:hypothetical protein ACFWJ3_19655, partial [Streptomyces ardesiacus]
MTPPQRQRRSTGAASDGVPAKEGEPSNPERLFVIGGEGGGERADLDLVTLIVARAGVAVDLDVGAGLPHLEVPGVQPVVRLVR